MDYEGNDMSDAVEVGGDVVRAKPGTYHILYVTFPQIYFTDNMRIAPTPFMRATASFLPFYLLVLPLISFFLSCQLFLQKCGWDGSSTGSTGSYCGSTSQHRPSSERQI
jgi:hypothetical protein